MFVCQNNDTRGMELEGGKKLNRFLYKTNDLHVNQVKDQVKSKLFFVILIKCESH